MTPGLVSTKGPFCVANPYCSSMRPLAPTCQRTTQRPRPSTVVPTVSNSVICRRLKSGQNAMPEAAYDTHQYRYHPKPGNQSSG
jgi:hypothetical protein